MEAEHMTKKTHLIDGYYRNLTRVTVSLPPHKSTRRLSGGGALFFTLPREAPKATLLRREDWLPPVGAWAVLENVP